MNKHIDLSIFDKFNFERKPVGLKYLLEKPAGLDRPDKKLALCEMLKEAQEAPPFYAAEEDFECAVGPFLLGMTEPSPIFKSGQVGARLGVFDDARANRRIYDQISSLASDSVNYVAFASYEKLSFDPDVLIITANAEQTEIILRALSYKTGEVWQSKGTTVIGCSWLFIYPYVSGEVNTMITGLYHGMKARRIYPEGQILISVPFDRLQDIVSNLQQIEWVLPQFITGKEEHIQRMQNIAKDLSREIYGE